MAEASTTLPANGTAQYFDPDQIFFLLSDASRRRVLVSLLNGAALSASQLRGMARMRQSSAEKHLTRLHRAGLLVSRPDRVDKRRMLYSLSPLVPVVKTQTGVAIHFGCCVLVCDGTVELGGIKPIELGGKD